MRGNGCRAVRRQELKMEASNSVSRGDEPREDPELTRNIWNHHAAAAALLARSTIVMVEDAD